MASIAELGKEWNENKEGYKVKETGSGVQSFIAKVFECKGLFGLKKTVTKTGELPTFVHDTESGKTGRPDFVIYVSKDFRIPVEAKCFERIDEGLAQLRRYQLDEVKLYNRQYGILTDGYEWRFYRASSYARFLLPEILDKPRDFITYWQGYIRPETYYIDVFNQTDRQNEQIALNEPAHRELFFQDVTRLIENFKAKMKAIGTWKDLFDYGGDAKADKVATETSYAYLIQFILYKVLVDNGYSKFKKQYESMLRGIREAIQKKDLYRLITSDIRTISEYISKHIYKPFAKEQESINERLMEKLTDVSTLDDIAPWLDIIIFINKYDFANLKNEIFGFVYENYLKDLYGSKNKGQYFTDPAVVDFILDQLGYTEKNLKKDKSRISLIDPSCGAGTFLYSAVDRIINTFSKDDGKIQSDIVKFLVDDNIFGLDIEEFPLFLAEMSILMRLLPLIVNDDYENPIDKKLKIFKTHDSISEFLDTGISSKANDVSLDRLKETAIDYPSFMRDEEDLKEMLESMQKRTENRRRFDYVIGNPPYVALNECGSFPFAMRMKEKAKNGKTKSISMGDVYGVNLHSIPDHRKKYPPKPNLYAFFIALGLALLKDKGTICYIVPQNVLSAGDLDVVRYHLAANTTMETIIMFPNPMFVGRGLKQRADVATSSLVFVAKKEKPRDDHNVSIVRYMPYAEDRAEDFESHMNGNAKKQSTLAQKELLDNVENWAFIRQDSTFLKMVRTYHAKTESMTLYSDHATAQERLNSRFWFDVGFILDKNHITGESSSAYPILDFKSSSGYSLFHFDKYYPKNTDLIGLTKNSQGYGGLGHKYQIVWRIKNMSHFHFTDSPVIFGMGSAGFIASDDRAEMLYLFALLDSLTNRRILAANLKNENEKDFLVSIKSIKRYIRVPKITPPGEAIKAEIISRTEAMLALEKIKLKDIADFTGISVQNFDSAAVSGDELILRNDGKSYSCKIQNGKSGLAANVVGKIKTNTKITLSVLKSAQVIDFSSQSAIKSYVDDLVFALYFNVSLPNPGFASAGVLRKACEKNPFYATVSR